MRVIIISSEHEKNYCRTLVEQSKIDGSETVVFKKTDKNPTAKQRRLYWMWCGEIIRDGLGADSTKEEVNTRAKWMFLRPILQRDDDVFPLLYKAFLEAVKGHPEGILKKYERKFAEQYISSELLTRAQRWEFMRDFQRYWVGKGANLTDPAWQGVDLNKY